MKNSTKKSGKWTWSVILLTLFLGFGTLALVSSLSGCKKESIETQTGNLQQEVVEEQGGVQLNITPDADFTKLSGSDLESEKHLKSVMLDIGYGSLYFKISNFQVPRKQYYGICVPASILSDQYEYTVAIEVPVGEVQFFANAWITASSKWYSYVKRAESTEGVRVIAPANSKGYFFDKPSSRTDGNVYFFFYGYVPSTANVYVFRREKCSALTFTSTTPNDKLVGTSCVTFIRGKVTTLSSIKDVPLNTYAEKKAICNVKNMGGSITKDIHYIKPGYVGVCASVNYPSYGHIFYIESVDYNTGLITICEGNSGGNFTRRTRYADTRKYNGAAGLNVDGFYNPCLPRP